MVTPIETFIYCIIQQKKRKDQHIVIIELRRLNHQNKQANYKNVRVLMLSVILRFGMGKKLGCALGIIEFLNFLYPLGLQMWSTPSYKNVGLFS